MTTTIKNTQFQEALSERYLAYALSTITARSLPDVRDGLKPVHRRLLFAMRGLGLKSSQPPKKSARVVGDVIGRYHPHGDVAVYETMVRLAQDFSVRYPLVDGQGNFGNIDGDSAAAMRYTEARLTDVAEALLEGLDDETVEFRPTYDGDGDEPVVLAARFPQLLANGATGIAVGMATNIPPHHIDEICAALQLLLKNPDAGMDEILNLIKGPDFPTGGVIVEPAASIREAYITGRGTIRLQARWNVEPLKNGQYQIIVTQIPYSVQKSRLVEKIAILMDDKKLPLLGDIRDESTDDVRLVLIPKTRVIEPEHLMASLFKQTDLENRFAMNLNALDAEGIPRVMDLKAMLQAFLTHRREMIRRQSEHRLRKINERLEVLAGFLIAYLNLDRIIEIIRNEDEPKPIMMAEMGLSDPQVEAILNMRLRSLRKLDEAEVRKEHDGLSAEKARLEELLKNPATLLEFMKKEVKDIQKKFGGSSVYGPRRTTFGEALDIVEPEKYIVKEPMTVVLSKKGWVRALRGHVKNLADQKYKDGDEALLNVLTYNTDQLILLTPQGKSYSIVVEKLPPGKGFGEPIHLILDIDPTEFVAVLASSAAEKYVLATKLGRGFVIETKDLIAQTKNGKQVATVDALDPLYRAVPVVADYLASVGENRKILIFKLADLPVMSKGKGVVLQKFKDGGLSDIMTLSKEQGLSWVDRGQAYEVKDLRPWLGTRAGAGKMAPTGFPLNNQFSK